MLVTRVCRRRMAVSRGINRVVVNCHHQVPSSGTIHRDGSRGLDRSPLKEVGRVEIEIRLGKTGQIERKDRDYLTNRHLGRLKPEPILIMVRLHWAIATNGNCTVDVIGDGKRKVLWCGQGVGIQGLGLLHLMAYHPVPLPQAQ